MAVEYKDSQLIGEGFHHSKKALILMNSQKIIHSLFQYFQYGRPLKLHSFVQFSNQVKQSSGHFYFLKYSILNSIDFIFASIQI